eukprot:EG_transcript_29997
MAEDPLLTPAFHAVSPTMRRWHSGRRTGHARIVCAHCALWLFGRVWGMDGYCGDEGDSANMDFILAALVAARFAAPAHSMSLPPPPRISDNAFPVFVPADS